MVYQVFQSTYENPVKNDFVRNCEKYLNMLDIKLSFKEIGEMSKFRFAKIVKEKIAVAAYNYLIAEKNKQTKIAHIKYSGLELQKYLMDGDANVDVSKLILKARSKTLDIKSQRKWAYEDTSCSGCKVMEETGAEILSCWYFGDDKGEKPAFYDMFYSEKASDIKMVGRRLMEKLRRRKEVIDHG